MAFPKSLKSNYIVKSLAAAGKHSSALNPFELAILDASTYESLAPGSVAGQEVIIAVGSPNQGQAFAGLKVERLHDQLNSTHSFKSQPITNPKQILTQKFTKDDKVNVYYLGWNGLNNACKSLEFECGKTYQFDLYVKGREVRNIFGREMRQVVDFTTPCCDCTGSDCNTSLNCGLYIDQLVARFNDPSFWLSRFYTAEAIVNCEAGDPITTPTLVTRNVYCLTVCDNGDELALAEVQNQYPDLKVTVKERSAPYTTYQVIDEAEDGLPTDFSQTPTVVFGCECPSGWTLVPSGTSYIVEVDNAVYTDNFDTDIPTTMETLLDTTAGDIATLGAATLISAGVSSSLYNVTVGGDGIGTVLAGVKLTSLGATQSRCEGSETATSWVSCGSVYKVERTVTTTVGVPDCGVAADAINGLTVEWEAYATSFGLTTPTAVADNDCVASYSAIQLSNKWLTDGCDTLGWRSAQWDVLPKFKGSKVTTDACTGFTVNEDTGCVTGPEVDTDCCQCGIKFTEHNFKTTDDLLGSPIYDINEYLPKDPIELSVGLLIPDGQTQVCTDTQPDFWQAQRATFRTLQGRDVMKEIVQEKFYRQEPFFNMTDKNALLLQKREGLRYGVDFDAYYFAVTLSHNVANEMNFTAHNSSVREDLVFFIHEDDAALYDQLVMALKQAFPVPIKSLNA